MLEGIGTLSQAAYIRLYSCWNIASFALLFYKELKHSDGLQPVVFIALVAIQYVGLNGLVTSIGLDEGEQYYLVSSNVTPYLGKSVWFLSLEHILILSGYFLIDYKNRYKPLPKMMNIIMGANIDYEKWAIRLYMGIWALRIIDYVIPLASLTSVLAGFANRGQLVVLTFLSYSLLRKKTSKVVRLYWLYWGIIVLEVFLVLNHGMKEEIIINLVPYAIYLLIGYRGGAFSFSAQLVTKLCLLGVVVVYGIFPYVAIFRSISKKHHISWSEVEVSEALSQYKDYIFSEGDFENADTSEISSDYFLSRAGSISSNAWSIHYAETHKPVYIYFYYCLARSVPRFLWPDKPPNAIGNMMYEMAGGNSNWEQKALSGSASSKQSVAITIGFIGGTYFSLGLWAALLFPFFAGGFVCWYWRRLKPMVGYNIIAIWAMYALIMTFLIDFESFIDGGANFYIISLMYLFIARKVFPMKRFA